VQCNAAGQLELKLKTPTAELHAMGTQANGWWVGLSDARTAIVSRPGGLLTDQASAIT
jgi:hypothetical protein